MIKHINLQLFAEEIIPAKEEGKTDSKQKPVSEFGLEIRKAFGLPEKKAGGKPDEKKPEAKPDTAPKPDEKKLDAKQDTGVKPEVKPEAKPEANKEPDTKAQEGEKKPDGKPAEEFIVLKHLGKEVRVPASDRDKYMQMGYDYPHVKNELAKSRAALQKAATLAGFKTTDEYLANLEKEAAMKVAEQIEEAAGDPAKIDEIVMNHPEIVKTREERRLLDDEKRQIALDRTLAELRKDEFFAELEPQFNELREQNPTVEASLLYDIIRSRYLTPAKLKELRDKEREAAKETAVKATLADIHDKEKRSAPTGGNADGGGTEVIQPTEFGKKIGNLFGLSKDAMQRAAQRTHELLKRS
jgi:hypothetical protein